MLFEEIRDKVAVMVGVKEKGTELASYIIWRKNIEISQDMSLEQVLKSTSRESHFWY